MLAWAAAGAQTSVALPGASGDAARYQSSRAHKDSLFRHAPSSPVPGTERASFAGLRYYPADPLFRVEGTMAIYGRSRRIQIPTTGDTTTAVDRFGRFTASIAGSTFSLEVYRLVESGELSVFFTDATNGKETYGGGRYAPVHAMGRGVYILDFNEAYNPYCAYNHSYVCPLPPPQNRLTFEVRAGEMSYGPELAPR